MRGTFFFLTVHRLGRGRKALEALSDLIVGLFPFLFRFRDFVDKVETPNKTLGFGIDEIDEERAFLSTGGGDVVVNPSPIRADVRRIRTPIAEDSEVDFPRRVGPITN